MLNGKKANNLNRKNSARRLMESFHLNLILRTLKMKGMISSVRKIKLTH